MLSIRTANFTYTYNAAGDMTLAASPGANYGFTYDEDHRVANVTQTDVLARSAAAFAGGLVDGSGIAGSFAGEVVGNSVPDALDGDGFSIEEILVDSAASAALGELLPGTVSKVPGRKPIKEAAKILGAHGAKSLP